jgi:hypothetical protein
MASLGRKEYIFCNLEMKHFTEKIISKLVVENNQVIQHPKFKNFHIFQTT